jgi:3-dehydroquinate dehydratase / shikimate dehydrogenase
MNSTKICVPISERSASNLREAIDKASAMADIIEIRLDYLEKSEFNEALRLLPDLLGNDACSFILTYRPAEQGGHLSIQMPDRYAFWSKYVGVRPSSNLVDIELDLALEFMRNGNVPINWENVICSYHDFNKVPSDLESIFGQMASTPAYVLKIAVKANTITDCIPLLHLLERARNQKREMIAIAMGQSGLLTRILAPSRGAFLTFASSDPIRATAPGQISAYDMRNLYHVHEINEETLITGLIGLPVGHSVSPHMHNAALAACQLNGVYIPFEVDNIDEFARRMVHPKFRELNWKLKGLSVTAPHKTSIMPHLDFIDPMAKDIGAVNTVVVEEDMLCGYNTDVEAALAPLRNRIGPLRGIRFAVLGAGGAARALLWGLKNEGGNVILFARDSKKATPLAEQFGIVCSPIHEAQFKDFDVVINTTPVGTRGKSEDESPVTLEQLKGARLAYDLIYNPSETRFMREAKEVGCETLGGLPMLVGQALEQFKLWTGNDSPMLADVMFRAAQSALENISR